MNGTPPLCDTLSTNGIIFLLLLLRSSVYSGGTPVFQENELNAWSFSFLQTLGSHGVSSTGWPRMLCIFVCPNMVWFCLGFSTCAQMFMHATVCRCCVNTVRETVLKVDPGPQKTTTTTLVTPGCYTGVSSTSDLTLNQQELHPRPFLLRLWQWSQRSINTFFPLIHRHGNRSR